MTVYAPPAAGNIVRHEIDICASRLKTREVFELGFLIPAEDDMTSALWRAKPDDMICRCRLVAAMAE